MTERSLRGWILGALALVAVISGADLIGHAAGATGQSRLAQGRVPARALEPGFTGTFLYRNLQTTLYDSSQAHVYPGPAVKLTVPTVANGSVYVGTQTRLAVFGLVPGAPPTPTATITATSTATPTATASITSTSTATPTASPSPVFATLNASPKSISFSDQVVGHQSKAAKVTVLDTAASMQVTLWQPTVSSGFVVTSSDCPGVLQPGASCTIEVASLPTSKGKQHGQLRLNSNAEFGLHTVRLKGKGVAAKMTASPQSLSFERVPADAVSSPQSITIVNRSRAPITFTAAPAATPPFNVSANTCGTIAANGGTCTISVEFAPHKRGKYEGTLELRDDAANSPQHLKLFGSSK